MTESAQDRVCAVCGEALSVSERQQEFHVHVACIRSADERQSRGDAADRMTVATGLRDPMSDVPEFVEVRRQNAEAAKRDRKCPWCDHWLLAGHLAEGCAFCECRVRITFAPLPGFLVSPTRARMLADIDAADEDD